MSCNRLLLRAARIHFSKSNHSKRTPRRAFTLIELLIVIAVIAILAGIAVPNILTSRRAGEETSAVGSLKAIDDAEASFRARNNTYGTLSELASLGLIDASLGAATGSASTRSGYFFHLQGLSSSQYFVVAIRPTPLSSDRQFYTDESDVIFWAPAMATSPTSDSDGSPPSSSFQQIGN